MAIELRIDGSVFEVDPGMLVYSAHLEDEDGESSGCMKYADETTRGYDLDMPLMTKEERKAAEEFTREVRALMEKYEGLFR